MTPLAPDQWILLVLAFLLGLFVGMFLLAGGKWKRRYREQDALHRDELRRRDAALDERQSIREDGVVADDPGRRVGRRRWFGR